MGKLPIRPIIVVNASPQKVSQDQMLRISARFFNKKNMRLMEVSRIFMSITSMKDGHVVWPLEVVRKNASGFDIGLGTEELQPGHEYLIRVSNNWNLSPSTSTTFLMQESKFPVGLLIPLILSPLFLRKYVDKGVRDVDGLVEYLRSQGLSDKKISEELERILKEIDELPEDQIRIPVDTTRDILRKIFITQMDHRVCINCEIASYTHSKGLPSGHYYPYDGPTIPLHKHCRCTYELIYAENEAREAAFRNAAYISQSVKTLELPLAAIKAIQSLV